jgi:hypothetical protein
MVVAAIYDIHGNLPALEAVLEEIRHAGADQVVVGGDVLPGPMPRETLAYLLDLETPIHLWQWRGCGVGTDGRQGTSRRPRTVSAHHPLDGKAAQS